MPAHTVHWQQHPQIAWFMPSVLQGNMSQKVLACLLAIPSLLLCNRASLSACCTGIASPCWAMQIADRHIRHTHTLMLQGKWYHSQPRGSLGTECEILAYGALQGRLLQITLPQEVCPDSSIAQRSCASSRLVVTMPLLGQSAPTGSAVAR